MFDHLPRQLVRIAGPIGPGGVTAESVQAQLDIFDPARLVEVEINSDGGSVQEGVAIYAALTAWPGGCETTVVGWALSVASLILMAGTVRKAHPMALVMVHAPWCGGGGNAVELRSSAAMLDAVARSMKAAYLHTGQKDQIVSQWLNDGEDHWFTAGEAKAVGLVTEIAATPGSDFANAAAGRHRIPDRLQAVMAHLTRTAPTFPEGSIVTTPATSPAPTAAFHDGVQAGIRAEQARMASVTAALQPFHSEDWAGEILARARHDPTMDEAAVNKQVLASLARGATSANNGRVVTIGDDGDADVRAAMRDALVMRGGVRIESPHPAARDFARASLAGMAEILLSRRGESIRGRSSTDIINAALSTSDFPSLMADVAHLSAKQGYQFAVQTHALWTDELEVPDFKPTTLALLSEAPSLNKVVELGEYTHGSLSDAGSKVQVETFGRLIQVSRQALINDSTQQLVGLPAALGASARRREADVVYQLLTSNPTLSDGVALFHAGHGNLAATGGAISLATLSSARAAMRRQKGVAGQDFIDPQPRFLIVPVELETAAEALLATLTSSTKGDTIAPEWVKGLTVVADPRLDATSTTAWYLASDPKAVQGIVRAYLMGADRPFLEDVQEHKVDATSWKCRLDFGCGVIDYRGLYRNPGA